MTERMIDQTSPTATILQNFIEARDELGILRCKQGMRIVASQGEIYPTPQTAIQEAELRLELFMQDRPYVTDPTIHSARILGIFAAVCDLRTSNRVVVDEMATNSRVSV